MLLDERDQAVADRLRQSRSQAQPIESVLTTNDRVIARVTDGIYRQPGSAVRELIANAYDADATWVTVSTDAPRFSRMTVEDNGSGMSPEAVVHLLHNIGGSAKRTEQGQELGVASHADPTLSPGGRKLIGKLGIGIFSVSQLTHSFQIVTKTKGDLFRTVVLVNLTQFADEPSDGDESQFKAGNYRVWREPSHDAESQGTSIVLTSIRPQTRESLRSGQLWGAIDAAAAEQSGGPSLTTVPAFHIGRLDSSELYVGDDLEKLRRLPWDDGDDPVEAFRKMVDSVWSAVRGRTSVKLADMFDTYLQMLWNLGLALPLPYVAGNVLDERVDDEWGYFYQLSNAPGGSAEKLVPSAPGLTLRQLAGLSAEHEADPAAAASSKGEFRVVIDGVQLSRPLRFRDLPTTQHALKKPMVFVGSLKEDFAGFDRDLSAGPLEFEAYLFWTPKVAPTEHQGALVRIHGASGTLFDSTFFNYQVAELTRLRQITCEIFVKQGLEAALNIDRESFNTAHPHTVVLTRWVHNALRQLATAQKREAQVTRESIRTEVKEKYEGWLDRIVQSANSNRTGGEGIVPEIHFDTSADNPRTDFDVITQPYSLPRMVRAFPESPRRVVPDSSLRKLESITKVLTVYGLLDQLSLPEQEELLGSILGILEADHLD